MQTLRNGCAFERSCSLLASQAKWKVWWGRSAKSRQSARVAIPQPKRGQRVLFAPKLSMSLGGINIGMLTSPLYISYYHTGCHLHMCVVCESEWQETQESCRKDVGECGAVEQPHKLLSIESDPC